MDSDLMKIEEALRFFKSEVQRTDFDMNQIARMTDLIDRLVQLREAGPRVTEDAKPSSDDIAKLFVNQRLREAEAAAYRAVLAWIALWPAILQESMCRQIMRNIRCFDAGDEALRVIEAAERVLRSPVGPTGRNPSEEYDIGAWALARLQEAVGNFQKKIGLVK